MEVLEQASECTVEGSESVSFVGLGLRFLARSDGSRGRVVNVGTEYDLAVNVAGSVVSSQGQTRAARWEECNTTGEIVVVKLTLALVNRQGDLVLVTGDDLEVPLTVARLRDLTRAWIRDHLGYRLKLGQIIVTVEFDCHARSIRLDRERKCGKRPPVRMERADDSSLASEVGQDTSMRRPCRLRAGLE